MDGQTTLREFLAKLARSNDAPAEELARQARQEIFSSIARKLIAPSFFDSLFAWVIENERRTAVRSVERDLRLDDATRGATSNEPTHQSDSRSFRRPVPGISEPIDRLAIQQEASRFAALARERFKVNGRWVFYGAATLDDYAARRTELERTRDGCNRSIALLDEIVAFIRDADVATLDEALVDVNHRMGAAIGGEVEA